MYKICVLPIYRRTKEVNEKEYLYAVKKIKSPSKSGYQYALESLKEDYKYEFNQVVGLIELLIDTDLFHLKAVQHIHEGKIYVKGKYRFDKTVVILDKSLLEIRNNNLVDEIIEAVKSIKLGKLFIDTDYLQNITLPKSLLNEYLALVRKSKKCIDYDEFMKCRYFYDISLNGLIDETNYNNFLKKQFTQRYPKIFPLVSYTLNEDTDIMKLVKEDLQKETSSFNENKIPIIIEKDREKLKIYYNFFNIDCNILSQMSIDEQKKYVYCHYYNYLSDKYNI